MRRLNYLWAFLPASFQPLLKGCLVVSSFTFATGAWAAEQAPPDQPSANGDQEVVITDKARAHFRAGVNLLQDPEGERYEEAYQQFKAAYEESPSWKILGNLGLSAMHLERYGEAIDAFTEYLDQGGDKLSEQEREQFARDRETLQTSVALMEITAPPGTNLTDVRSGNRGADVKNYYVVPEGGTVTLRVRPGQHQVSAEASGESLGTWKVRLDSQKSEAHEFRSGPAAAEPSQQARAVSEPAAHPYRIPGYVALGVGAVGIGVGAAFLAVHASQTRKSNQLFDDCEQSGTCGKSERTTVEDRDKKAALAGTISWISFGVGAVGIGAGVTLLLLKGPAPEGERPLEAKVGAVRLSPYVDAHQVGLFGSF